MPRGGDRTAQVWAGSKTSRKNLKAEDRRAVIDFLLQRVGPTNTLRNGALTEAAALFKCNASTVKRLWDRATHRDANGMLTVEDVFSRRNQCGRKSKYPNLCAKLAEIPKTKRTTIQAIAGALKMPYSTLQWYIKRGVLIKRSSTIKPVLTDANKMLRMKWALDHVAPDFRFHPMYDYVHVDEKWYYMARVKRNMYLLPGESLPERYCKSTRFIGKVMFLAAVARPRWDYERNEWFDGKIGTWHFTEEVPAVRCSRNRPAGTMETKPVNVDRSVYKAMLLDKVIPAIKSKWPTHESKCVKIQQDNARPHISPSDAEIMNACTQDGWKMQLVCQPPNSPDLNVLDLGFFRAVQTIQQRENCTNLSDLISATEKAWAEVPMANLSRNFLTLQSVMVEILRVDGGNHCKIPHMKKSSLMAQGRLPDSISINCSRHRPTMISLTSSRVYPWTRRKTSLIPWPSSVNPTI